MKTIIARLLASAVLSAAVTGAAVGVGQQGPSAANIPGLDEFAALVPDAAQWQYITIRTNNRLFAETLSGGVDFELTEEWSESSYVQVYDAAGHSIGTYFPPADETDESAMAVNEYDADGNIVRSVSYLDGQPYTESLTTYDSAGRIQSRTSRRDGEIVDGSEFYYTPQEDGTYLRRIRYDIGREETEVVNAAGQILRSGSDDNYATWTYDDKGRTVETVIKTETLSQRAEYIYQDAADGSYICTDTVYENGALRSRTESRYDAQGICIYGAQYTADGGLMTETITEFFTP